MVALCLCLVHYLFRSRLYCRPASGWIANVIMSFSFTLSLWLDVMVALMWLWNEHGRRHKDRPHFTKNSFVISITLHTCLGRSLVWLRILQQTSSRNRFGKVDKLHTAWWTTLNSSRTKFNLIYLDVNFGRHFGRRDAFDVRRRRRRPTTPMSPHSNGTN